MLNRELCLTTSAYGKCEIFHIFKGPMSWNHTLECCHYNEHSNLLHAADSGGFTKTKWVTLLLTCFSNILDGRVQSDDECFSLTLENILQFATGATYPPPLGFDDNPEIGFAHDSTVTLPTANTCSPTLTLPTAITDIDIFKSRMTYAIFNSVGFGHV